MEIEIVQYNIICARCVANVANDLVSSLCNVIYTWFSVFVTSLIGILSSKSCFDGSIMNGTSNACINNYTG